MSKNSTCIIEEFNRPPKGLGWCGTHYEYNRINGFPIPKEKQSLEERFLSKVQKTDTCWLWTASQAQTGYGQFYYNYKNYKAHRFSYEFYKGAIPEGLYIDHLCHIALCVNPEHLEAVTPLVNAQRGYKALRKYCLHGHEFTEENTYIRKQGSRMCRTCIRYQVKMAKIKKQLQKP